MNRHVWPFAVLAVALMTVVVCQAQEPTLDEVIDRLGRYISDYETKVVELAAEEEYEQRVKRKSGYGGEVVERRKLTSTFFFYKLPSGQAWFGLRDVTRVDGKAVSARDRSVEQLLQEGTLEAVAEANRIVRKNADYNIGAVYRTANLPLMAIELLRAEHRRRFEFTSAGRPRMGGARVWQIAYAERVKPSLIHDGFGGDRLSNGHVWVDPTTGAVHKTEIIIDKVNTISVEFERNDRFQMLLPSAMEEDYELAIEFVRGRATYRDYRRFQTSGRVVDK
jgi:outer membrane lipoprotein-sorting protein